MTSDARAEFEQRWTARLQPAILACFMSGFVSAVVTAINTGIAGDFAWRWFAAWMIALPAAVLAVYLARPTALRLARAASRVLWHAVSPRR